VTGTLAVAEGGRWTVDAVDATATRGPDGWTLAGTKSHVLDGATAHELAVVARAPDGIGVFLVPGSAAGDGAVWAEPLAVMDPTLPLATVVLDGVAVGDDRVLVAPGSTVDGRTPEEAIEGAVQEATAMLALSTVATCRAIFEATVAYAKDREQFGRPIGSFQAVKHRLADCYLAVERAHALAWFAVATVAEDDPRRAVATSMAKAAAGDCQRLLTRDGLQLHGGIGFTWEHDLHLLLKRALTGELLLGTSAQHRARLAVLLGLEPAA
jgi:alkylation response protein AidB-like acyl-CoA dehydrogenase